MTKVFTNTFRTSYGQDYDIISFSAIKKAVRFCNTTVYLTDEEMAEVEQAQVMDDISRPTSLHSRRTTQ